MERRKIRRWFNVHLESVILVVIVGLFVLFCLLLKYGVFSFQLGDGVSSIFGSIVESLAAILAIAFSISLVAIQLCSENLSHRLIGLYVKNRSFAVPFGWNLGALLFDFFLLCDERCSGLVGYGVLVSVFAVVSLVLFFVFTVRFLRPVHAVRILLGRVETKNLLSKDFAERELYREYFQPIEDIVSSCSRKGDYATVHDLIELIREKMYSALGMVRRG